MPNLASLRIALTKLVLFTATALRTITAMSSTLLLVVRQNWILESKFEGQRLQATYDNMYMLVILMTDD